MQKIKTHIKAARWLRGINFRFLFLIFIFGLFFCARAEDNQTVQPITINGDTVEYSTDGKEATASGNVSVIYKGAKLSCKKLTLNTLTKDAVAEGDVRLDDAKGVIQGSRMVYNFQTKKGIIFDSGFRANPYFGKAEKTNKISDDEFLALRGYMTTCSYDHPHYRIKSKKMDFFPGDKIQTKEDTFYAGNIPLLCLPQYNHSLREPLAHVQLLPGKSKHWGPYMLTAWQYSLTEDVKGRIYLDYRAKLGIAEGFGTNYIAQELGKGDFKFYYTQERNKTKELGEDVNNPKVFQRYLIRWRHKWDVDAQTQVTSEYYKFEDSKMRLYGSPYNFLKDFFPREYEKDTQPLSYLLFHHSFDYASLDFLAQMRTNRWYAQEEKLPEIKYSLPSYQIGQSPFYFTNYSSYVNYASRLAVPSPSWDDTVYNEFDTTNRFSLPSKIAFISFTPFISGEETYWNKNLYGATSQVVFSEGTDMSTKFYRLFNVKSNFLGLNINNLRHIITPTVNYTSSKTSTMPAGSSRFGGAATLGSSSFALDLSNKLQTKRDSKSVDLVDLDVTSSYLIKPKSGEKRGSSFSDFLFKLKLLPYSWMSVNADATYKHTDKYLTGYSAFSNVNYDLNFSLSEEHTFAIGQRYLRKGGNEITTSLDWRLNPKWRFLIYQRRNIGHDPTLKRGVREQEYTISRDCHCWFIDLNYNVKRGYGETIWVVFRLKAFPELEFNLNNSYHAPKPGSQSNP